MRGTDDCVRWVIQAQCGDRDGMEHVLRAIQTPLRRYVQRLVGPTATDDVLQTTLISIAKHLKWLAEPRLVRPWAFGLPPVRHSIICERKSGVAPMIQTRLCSTTSSPLNHDRRVSRFRSCWTAPESRLRVALS
jgi:hypothetical protein